VGDSVTKPRLSSASCHVLLVWALQCILLPVGLLALAPEAPRDLIPVTVVFAAVSVAAGVSYALRVRVAWHLVQVCLLAGWLLGAYYSNRVVFICEALLMVYLGLWLYAREVREEFAVHVAPREAGVLIVLLVMCALLALLAPKFVEKRNFLDLLRQFATVGVMAVGMTMVIVLGGIDLSVGSIVALAGCLGAMAYKQGWNPALAILIALAVGGATGAFNGGFTSCFRINPFIITLGTMSMARSLANVITNGNPVHLDRRREEVLGAIGLTAPLRVPTLVWMMAVVVILGHIFLSRTRTGRHIYYIGANEEAARLSGINVMGVKWLVYALCGLLAGLAAIMQAARLGSGQPSAGTGDELRVIAAVIIGGASFTGGEGTVLGALVGTVILGVLTQGLNLLEVSSHWKKCVEGAVIIGAVAVGVLRRYRARH